MQTFFQTHRLLFLLLIWMIRWKTLLFWKNFKDSWMDFKIQTWINQLKWSRKRNIRLNSSRKTINTNQLFGKSTWNMMWTPYLRRWFDLLDCVLWDSKKHLLGSWLLDKANLIKLFFWHSQIQLYFMGIQLKF